MDSPHHLACYSGPENVRVFGDDGSSLHFGIVSPCAAYDPYAGLHVYRNLPYEEETTDFRLDLQWRYASSAHPVQAFEFTMNKFTGSQRFEWALQWENIGDGTANQGTPPTWRVWSGSRWIAFDYNQNLAPDVWHTLTISGNIQGGQVHYNFFKSDATLYTLGQSYAPVAHSDPAKLAVAVQLDGDGFMHQQDLYLDQVDLNAKPSIAAVTMAPDGNIHAIQVDSWVAIWGTNLAPAGSGRTWGSQDIVNGQLPLSLDGVSVTINGKPAYVEYISPTQVNVLAPPDTTTGAVDVVLTTGGVPSAPFSVPLQTYAPAFFTFGPPIQNYIAGYVTKPDGSFDAYLAPVGALGAGVSSRPAKPGDTVVLFGTGFGPTNPAPPVGQVFFGAYPTATPVTMTIGGVSAVVQWAGISAAGVYQFNVTVPSVPDGDAKVIATVGGAPSETTLYIPVQH